MGLGIDCKLYRNTATFGSPTWDEIDTVSDVSINGQWNRGDGSTRQSPVIMSGNTQLSLSISGRIRADLTNTDWESLWDAWKANSLIDVMALTGGSTTNDNTGVRFEADVVNFSQAQGLGDYVFNDFSLEPRVSTNLPDSVEISTGAPVFTDF